MTFIYTGEPMCKMMPLHKMFAANVSWSYTGGSGGIVVIILIFGFLIFSIIGLVKAVKKYNSEKDEREELRKRQEQSMREKQKQEQEAIARYDKTVLSMKEEDSSSYETKDDWESKIKQLKELLDCGAITEEEYQQQKNKYLGL